MSLLLDSNVVLWWIGGRRIDRRARARIERECAIVSAASVWEVAIKQSLGKLRLERALIDDIDAHDFERLAITAEHAARAGGLPLHHRDPFDRMLVAQAQLERLTIVTRDPAFDRYDVDVVRC